jgi:hypothetical protein
MKKKRINIWIPIALYTKLAHTEHQSITEVIVKALEFYLNKPETPAEKTEVKP